MKNIKIKKTPTHSLIYLPERSFFTDAFRILYLLVCDCINYFFGELI